MASIVTTLLLPEGRTSVVDSFVAYHLGIGFEHIFLFLDHARRGLEGPNTEVAVRLLAQYGGERLSIFFRSDEDVEKQQKERCAASYARLEQYLEDEVQARQTINAELATVLAEDKGLRWLLHIDIDELFYVTSRESVEEHFASLDAQGIMQMTYTNHEGVPESLDCVDYFRSISLFRVHHFQVPLTSAAHDAIEYWKARTNHGQYMLVYDCGKSAVRLGRGKVTPRDVHRWNLPPESASFSRTSLADARHLNPSQVLAMKVPCILHFVTCGLSWFLDKYRILGHFPDAWFNGALPIAPSFHLDARDSVMSQVQEESERFFRKQVLYEEDPNHLHAQLACGVLARYSFPSIFLTLLKEKEEQEEGEEGEELAQGETRVLKLRQLCDTAAAAQTEAAFVAAAEASAAAAADKPSPPPPPHAPSPSAAPSSEMQRLRILAIATQKFL